MTRVFGKKQASNLSWRNLRDFCAFWRVALGSFLFGIFLTNQAVPEWTSCWFPHHRYVALSFVMGEKLVGRDFFYAVRASLSARIDCTALFASSILVMPSAFLCSISCVLRPFCIIQSIVAWSAGTKLITLFLKSRSAVSSLTELIPYEFSLE